MTSRLATTLAALSLIALMPAGAQISVVPSVHSPLPLGTASIDGRVVTDAGTPAGGATVTLRQPIDRFVDSDGPHYEPRTTTTDADGKFSFEKLGSEVVEIVASTSGAPDVVYGQTRPGLPGTPLRLSEGQRLSVTLRFARASLITGTVFDTAGAPAAGIKVFAFRTLPLSEGESLMAEGADTMANVRGEYRLSGLTSGRFVVMAYRDRGGDQGLVVPIDGGGFGVETAGIYRDAADVNAAEQIDLRPGDERYGIDLHLRMAPVTTIDGVVRGPDGKPVGGAKLWLADASARFVGTAASTADGSFRLPRVQAGAYELYAASPGEVGWCARVPVTTDGRSAARVAIDLRPGAVITGRVVGDGAEIPAHPPFSFFFARIVKSTQNDAPTVVGDVQSPAFTFRGVAPGHYVIKINRETLPSGWTMQSEMVDGQDALDVPFEVRADEPHDVTIRISNRSTEIAGAVQDGSGQPVVDRTIAIFASDDRYWTPGSRRIAVTRPDTNGKYRIRGLPAGDYDIAVADADLDGLPSASLLNQWRSGASHVVLTAGASVSRNILVSK